MVKEAVVTFSQWLKSQGLVLPGEYFNDHRYYKNEGIFPRLGQNPATALRVTYNIAYRGGIGLIILLVAAGAYLDLAASANPYSALGPAAGLITLASAMIGCIALVFLGFAVSFACIITLMFVHGPSTVLKAMRKKLT